MLFRACLDQNFSYKGKGPLAVYKFKVPMQRNFTQRYLDCIAKIITFCIMTFLISVISVKIGQQILHTNTEA